MYSLHCTPGLLAHMGTLPPMALGPSSNRLGRWCGALAAAGGCDLGIFVNPRTGLAVAAPLSPDEGVLDTFVLRLENLLLVLGLKPDIILREIGEMADVAVGAIAVEDDSARLAAACAFFVAALADEAPDPLPLTQAEVEYAETAQAALHERKPVQLLPEVMDWSLN